MRYLAALIMLFVVSCAAVEFGPAKFQTVDPYPAVGALYRGSVARCTVTLIDECVVLTAAHCIYPGEPYTVRLGNVMYDTVDALAHPSYDGGWVGDLGLITLDRSPPITPIPINRTPIGLAQFNEQATVVGCALNVKHWEDQWLLGKLEETDLILWADSTLWIQYGDSGGPLIWEDCVAGVNVMSITEWTDPHPWRIDLSTDVEQYTEWIDEYTGADPS